MTIRFRWRGTPVTITPDFWGIGVLCVLIGGMRSGKADWADWVFYVGLAFIALDFAQSIRSGKFKRAWLEKTGKK